MRHSDEESLSFYAVLTCYVLPMCCVIAASVATLQLLGSCVHMADSGPTGEVTDLKKTPGKSLLLF